MHHAWHYLMFTLFNVPVSLNYNKDPKNFKVSVIFCMPIKPAYAFQAFQREGEGVIYRFLCFSPSISFNGLIVWKPKQEFKVTNHNIV